MVEKSSKLTSFWWSKLQNEFNAEENIKIINKLSDTLDTRWQMFKILSLATCLWSRIQRSVSMMTQIQWVWVKYSVAPSASWRSSSSNEAACVATATASADRAHKLLAWEDGLPLRKKNIYLDRHTHRYILWWWRW